VTFRNRSISTTIPISVYLLPRTACPLGTLNLSRGTTLPFRTINTYLSHRTTHSPITHPTHSTSLAALTLSTSPSPIAPTELTVAVPTPNIPVSKSRAISARCTACWRPQTIEGLAVVDEALGGTALVVFYAAARDAAVVVAGAPIGVQASSGGQQTASLGALIGSGMQIWVLGQVDVGGVKEAHVPAWAPLVRQVAAGG
jgi:hypothetical protein